jgi:hypothetical protein
MGAHMSHVGRIREFITLLGSAAAGWPLAARAQQAALPVVGVLISQTLGPYAERIAAFHRGLKEGGFVGSAVRPTFLVEHSTTLLAAPIHLFNARPGRKRHYIDELQFIAG